MKITFQVHFISASSLDGNKATRQETLRNSQWQNVRKIAFPLQTYLLTPYNFDTYALRYNKH